MDKSAKVSRPLWLRPFATALLDADAIKRLEIEYTKPDNDFVEEMQMQIYDNEKQKCVEKYGEIVEVAYNFDLIFSLHVMQLYTDIHTNRKCMNNEMEICNIKLIEQIEADAELRDKNHELLQNQFDVLDNKCTTATKRVKVCEDELKRLTSGYKMVICELKSLDNMHCLVIAAQVYICIILAIGSCMIVNIGCNE
jgi:hypothetical protein